MAAKSPLNRHAFVEAALEVIDEVGVDKLSMRNVAVRLDVSPMAVYKHFPAKEDLLAAALEEFITRANVIPEDDLQWDRWVNQLARGMYEALGSELSWVPLLGSLRLGTQSAAVADAFVRKLCRAGFTTEQALQAFFAVIQIVVGAVCLCASLAARRDEVAHAGADLSPVTQDYLENIDSERLRIAPVLESTLRYEQIDLGLPLLLGALKSQLAETAK